MYKSIIRTTWGKHIQTAIVFGCHSRQNALKLSESGTSEVSITKELIHHVLKHDDFSGQVQRFVT